MAVAGDLEYRIAGRGGIVVVTLRPGEGLLAEPGGLLYRRGGVGWSLASTGRNVLGRFLNRAMRRAAGASSLMHHYEGPGELALAAAPACRLIATRLEPGDNLVVERRCLVAASAGVTVDVALSRALRRRGEAGRVVLMRLTGAGVAFLQAAESSTELELASGEELEAPVAAVVCFELRLARIGGGDREWSGWRWALRLQARIGGGIVHLGDHQTPPAGPAGGSSCYVPQDRIALRGVRSVPRSTG